MSNPKAIILHNHADGKEILLTVDQRIMAVPRSNSFTSNNDGSLLTVTPSDGFSTVVSVREDVKEIAVILAEAGVDFFQGGR